MSDIERLSDPISQSVQLIANACSSRGVSLPDLNSAFDKDADAAFRGIPGVTDAVNIIAAAAAAAAAARHTSALLPPAHQLQNIGGAYEGHACFSLSRCSNHSLNHTARSHRRSPYCSRNLGHRDPARRGTTGTVAPSGCINPFINTKYPDLGPSCQLHCPGQQFRRE